MGEHFEINEHLYTAIHKCIRCGQCTYGKDSADFEMLCPLSMKSGFFTFSAGGLIQIARALYEGKMDPSESVRELAYLCTTCGACEVNCGVIEGHVDLITLLKNALLKSGVPLLPPHERLVRNTVEKHSPYSGRLPERIAWLGQEMKEGIASSPEVFYFVGCVSSYRETEIAESFVSILKKLEVPFAVSEDEWCCGAPLNFSGNEEKAVTLARHNAEMIRNSGAPVAVFTCPTCSMIFKKYYPRWLKAGLGFEVMHITEFLEIMQKTKPLPGNRVGTGKKGAYHDPCHLGRGQGIYDAPRKILTDIVGTNVEEFPLHGENSLCCGGGGLVPAGFPEFSDDLALDRVMQAREMDVEMIISSCPSCKENMKIAAKRSRPKIKVVDIVELVDQAISAE